MRTRKILFPDYPDSVFSLAPGPLVNTEFYAGWLDYWGDHHHRVSPSLLTHRLEQMIGNNATNVNLYVFHGGSSFGYINGADDTPVGFLPVVTSYDYDAPLTEAGDVTHKYHAICAIIAKCKGKVSELKGRNDNCDRFLP